ncbi:MAG: M20/M25/M40 family metallo-hydrolase [Catalinimonas sp.]
MNGPLTLLPRLQLLPLLFGGWLAAASAWAQAPEDLLSDYIQVASESGAEGTAGRFLADYCRERGLAVEVFDDLDSAYNFTASLYPLSSGRPNIVLLHHIDVVPAHADGWTHPPYAGRIADGAVWGRGAIDAKGLGVMHLAALLHYREEARRRPLPYNVTMLAVSGEETGGLNGSARIVEHHPATLNAAVVFGEGGSGVYDAIPSRPEVPVFGVSVAEKTSLWLRLDLQMRASGHGAAPPPQYANRSMLRALYKLQSQKTKFVFTDVSKQMFRHFGELEGGVKGYVLKRFHWRAFRPIVRNYVEEQPLLRALVSNTYTVTNITNPPGPINQIPSLVTTYLDCRLLPGTTRKKFLRELRRGLFEPRFDVTVLDESPAAPPTEPDAFYDAFAEAIKEVYPDGAVLPILFPATTDNNYYRAAGVPTYGLVPIVMSEATIASIHGTDEHLNIQALHRGVDVFKRLLARFLGPTAEMSIEVELR